MATLTKADLAEYVCAQVNLATLNKALSKDIVDLLFEEIRGALERGEPVKISGFGNFALRKKAHRPGRNPRTGESKIISARRVVTFKPGQKLKLQVARMLGTEEATIEKSV